MARLKIKNKKEEEESKTKNRKEFKIEKWCHICEEDSHIRQRNMSLNVKDNAMRKRDKWCHICDIDNRNTKDYYFNLRERSYRGQGRGRGRRSDLTRHLHATRSTLEVSKMKPPLGRCLLYLEFGHWKLEYPTSRAHEQCPFVCKDYGPRDHKVKNCKGKAKVTNLITRVP